MIFIHNEIDLARLSIENIDLKKERKTLDANIIYIEFKNLNGNYETKIIDLTKDIFNEEFKTFDLNKFNENIDNANSEFLFDLKLNVNKISEENANNSSDLISYLNKSTFFGSSFYLSKDQIGNQSIGGNSPGYGTVNYILSYIKNFDKNPTLDVFQSNRLFNIKKFFKSFLKKDKELDFIFANSLLKDKELFIKTIENIEFLNLDLLFDKELVFDFSKPTMFIWNIDGIRNQYIINNEVDNIKNYYNTIIYNDNLDLSNVSCKCCLRKDVDLEKNEIMSKYSEYVNIANTKLVSKFNLEDIEKNDFSLIVCSTCKEKIKKNNNILEQYKFLLLKEKIGRNSEIEVIDKSYYKNSVELLNSNEFGYLYKINKFDNVYNFSYEFDYKSNNNLSLEEIKQNYLTINTFLGKLENLENKHLYIAKYSFLMNHYTEDKKIKIFEIDKYFNHFMNFYLNGNKLNLNVFVSLLNELYLKKILNKSLNIKFFKDKYFELLIKLTTIGEKNMGIKENINYKLEKLELENKQLELLDEEIIVLSGRILSYLNSKSKEKDKTLNYIGNIKNFSVENLNKILTMSLLKYASAIGNNQIKLKTSTSYILDKLRNIKMNKLEIETLFLIGALAEKNEIKLTKTGE